MTLFGVGLSGSARAEKTLPELMARPLIVGASVSADQSTSSPGKRLALRFTKASEIKTIAIGGMPSTKVLPSVRPKDIDNRTIVIGLDLFFWDSTLASVTPSLKALDQLVSDTRQRNIPLVLGEVPELLPGMQPSRVAINEAIRKHCRNEKNCFVLELDSLLQQVLKDGYLTVKGQRYTLSELVPDGLHLGSIAGEEIANRLAALLQ